MSNMEKVTKAAEHVESFDAYLDEGGKYTSETVAEIVASACVLARAARKAALFPRLQPGSQPHQTNGVYIYEIAGKPREIDAAIFPIVKALNDAGLTTIASCCGHGNRPGTIILEDGRELIIARDFDEAREVDRAFPDIHGDTSRENYRGTIPEDTTNE